MSAKSESIVKSLLESIQSPNKETQPYDTSATVTRVEDGTVFVHIPGGVAETPCSKTISCKVGDTVQVRVGGGKAWLVGNASAPPTDDTTANTAIRKTNQLGDSLTKLQKIAGNTDQYFWHVETGEDTGSHITEIPKKRFLEAPALGGGNLLLRSNGIAIRDGLNELATFSSTAIQFNQPGTQTVVASIGSSGLYIQKGVIKLGNKTSASDTTNSGTYIDANGNMATSNILATGGEIGGWTISNNGLIAETGTSSAAGWFSRIYPSGIRLGYGTSSSSITESLQLSSSQFLLMKGTYQYEIDVTNGNSRFSGTGGYTDILTGSINMVKQSGYGDCVITCMNGNYKIGLDTTASGDRGIWDYGSSSWICYKNASGNAYFNGQASSVSDLKRKSVITDYDWKVDDFICGLKPIAFYRKAEDGSIGDRVHYGFGAQDVKALADKTGLENLGVYHARQTGDDELSWSLVYEELIAPMVLEIQRLMHRVDELEAKHG